MYKRQPLNCVTTEEAEALVTEVPAKAPAAYDNFAEDKAQSVIGGAIVSSVLDRSHPLTFGFPRPELPLLRKGTTLLRPSANPYASPVRYTASPLMAGFIGPEQLTHMSGQPALIAERKGRGLVVRFANNPIFRGFWRGTERLYINALYFGRVIEPTELPVIVPPARP